MKKINNVNDIIDIDEDNVLIFLENFKDFYNHILLYVKTNYDKETFNKFKENTSNLVKLLIEDGEVYQDIVLKTILGYYFEKEFNKNLTCCVGGISATLRDGIDTLKKNQDEDKQKNIFSHKLSYLSKIEPALLILKLKNQDKDKTLEYIKTLKLVDYIIKNFSKKFQNKLMKKLIDIRNSI